MDGLDAYLNDLLYLHNLNSYSLGELSTNPGSGLRITMPFFQEPDG
jgi:hypothetical protein